MANIKEISKINKAEVKLLRVVSYDRVSSSKDAQLHSLSAQVSYYKNFIESKPGWTFIDIYVDEGITGTKASRPAFVKMMNEAKNNKFDMIITKSISRFARNTVTLLDAIRELKALNIDVYFEEQNIHTLSSDGELMLTLLASIAQEESLSVSENTLWRVKRNFENGIPWGGRLLGYKMENQHFVIIKEEAEIVKIIFKKYLEGKGTQAIARYLNSEHYWTRYHKSFTPSSVRLILRNYTYTGSLLLQRYYQDNHINKKKLLNNGEKQMYHIENSHAAIIDIETFNKVQNLIEKRKTTSTKIHDSLFTSKLICGICKHKLKRKTNKGKPYWICPTYFSLGKEACSSHKVPESILIEVTSSLLKTYELTREVMEQISLIEVNNDNLLTFHFIDGRKETRTWKYKSRSESWTDEMKEQARIRALEVKNGKQQSNNH